MTKRDIFDELMGGFDAMNEAREGKLTLKRYAVEGKPASQIIAEGGKNATSPVGWAACPPTLLSMPRARPE